MTGNTRPIQKLRALFLAALMVFSVFAGSIAFAGTAIAANAGNAASVTADPIDTTNSETSNITVVQEDNAQTAAGEVEIAINDSNGDLIATFDSSGGFGSKPSTPGLEAVGRDGNETEFEINTTELANNNNFELGTGSISADADNGQNPDATSATPDANTPVDLQGVVVSDATSDARVAANDTQVEFTLNVTNTGSDSVTQDIELVSSGVNNTFGPANFTNEDFTQVAVNNSVTVAGGANSTQTFTINTGDLPGATDAENRYDIAGFTSGSPVSAAVVNPQGGSSLITGSGTEGSVTISVVDDASTRQQGVEVELFLERDFDNPALVIDTLTTNANGEVTFSGLAVGSSNNSPIRYTARAGADTAALQSTTTTLALFEPTQTSDSSTVVTDRLRQPERIEVEPDEDTAIADGSDTVSYTATVFGGLDGVPGSSDDQPLQGAEVELITTGDALSFGGDSPTSTSSSGSTLTRTYTTDSNGEIDVTVSSTEVQSTQFEFDATAGNSAALEETVVGNFVLDGEGNLAGTVNNAETTNPIPDASVYLVSDDDFTANERITNISEARTSLSSLGANGDDTVFVRLVDNETNEPIDNDEYDLRQSNFSATGDDASVRKIEELNESDAAVGQGYALIDRDDNGHIEFNHTRLLNENYTLQVSDDAANSSAGPGVSDVGTENFQNVTSVTGPDNTVQTLGGPDPVVFEPTENLTLEATEQLSGVTDANFVDSPGFVNSEGIDTEGTTDNGRFVLTQVPTNFQSGQQFVAIATKTGFSTDFADVFLEEDGSFRFTETQGSNEFFLDPVEADPDGVEIQQLGVRANQSASLVQFSNKTDRRFQEVPRDGETVDVFEINTTQEGTLVNATAEVSINRTSVAGEFVDITGGEFVSRDNATNTATIFTGADGQAEISYQADADSTTVNATKDAVLEADSSATDSSNVQFVGVLSLKSAEVSGIVTDSNNRPVPSVVFASEFTADGVDFTVSPADGTLTQFTISRLDTSGNVVESATVNRSQIDTTGDGYEFNVNASGNQVFTGVSLDSSVSGLTLVTDSADGTAESSSYTLPRVPAVQGASNDVVITATSDASISGTGTLQNGTSVTTTTEVNRTSTANVEISGAVAPQFVVTNVTATPNPATEGETLSVTATVENQGAVTASTSLTYSFGETVSSATEQGQQTTGRLAAGNSETVTFTLDSSGRDPGDYVHLIESDENQQTTSQTIENSTTGNGSALDQYVDDSGVVTQTGLNDAVEDYLNDDLSDDQINQVISSFLGGNPIDG